MAEDTRVTQFFSNLGKPQVVPASGATPSSDVATEFFGRLVSSPTPAPSPIPRPSEESKKTQPLSLNIITGLDFKSIGQSLVAGAKALPSMTKQASGIVLGSLVQTQKAIQAFFAPSSSKVLSAITKTAFPFASVPEAALTEGEKTAVALREEGAKEARVKREEYQKVAKPSTGLQGILELAAYNLPQMAASTGLSVATAIVTKNPALAASVGLSTSYGMGASEVYQEARDNNLSDSQAMPISVAGGIIIGALDFLPLQRLIKKVEVVDTVKKSIIKKIAEGIVSTGIQSGFEGITESAQELVGGAIARTYNENRDIFQGVTEAGLVGMLLGGIGEVTVSGLVGVLGEKATPESVIKDVEEKTRKVLESPTEKQPSGVQEVIRTFSTKDFTPDEAATMVLENSMEDTGAGKSIMKAVAQSTKDQFIHIEPTETGDGLSITVTNDRMNIPSKKTISETGEPITKKEKIEQPGALPIPEGKSYRIVDKSVQERHILSTKETRSLQSLITEKLTAIRESSKSPSDLQTGIDALYAEVIEKAKNDKVVLSSFRTAINKEMYTLAGATGNYKEAYAALKTMQKDPEIGPALVRMEELISTIDEKLLTAQEPTVIKEKSPKEQRGGKGTGPVKPVNELPAGTAKKKPSRLYQRVKDSLTEEYAAKDVSYNTLNLEEQAQKVADLIESDPKKAARIAYGLEETPPGMTRNALAVGLAELARTQNDMGKAATLWTKLSLRATRLGQEIVSLRGNLSDTEPFHYVKQVVNDRLERVARQWKDLAKQLDLAENATLMDQAVAIIKRKTQDLKAELLGRSRDFQTAQSIINALKC
jgi:hypothetical protein